MKGNKPTGIVRSVADRLSESITDLRMLTIDLVCRGFCEYYREGRGGEDDCAGFAAILRGIETKTLTNRHFRQMLGVIPDPAVRYPLLTERLCSQCDYLKDDGCDFMAPSHKENSSPCGGYRLILGLLETGSLTDEEVAAIL